MKPFIVIYLDDDNNMLMKEFDTENGSHSFMEDKKTKFVVIHGNVNSVDMTYSS